MEFATIGTALTSRRKTLNIDQARAAAIIGMSRTTFSSYERDLQRPSAEVLPSLAQFLEISIEDILSLYGGTCIAALRPSLEQFLATRGVDGTDRPPGGNVTPPTSTLDSSASPAPKESAPEVESSDSSVGSASTVDDADDSDDAAGSGADPIPPNEPATPAPVKDASVSIFANELSQGVPRATASTSPSSDSDQREPKASKGKDGKKKKGKKGKRAKS
jgi:transcriptional regulator with XRE-family HTH domain